jgi:polyisoprenoid-binding protein YceI
MTIHRRFIFAACAILLPLTASAASYSVQSASTLGFTGTFQGASFDGKFNTFTAAITYDEASLATSKFDVVVDLASAKTGDNDRDGALPGVQFFDTGKFPKAHFVTTGFVKSATGVVANGTLTLHGVTKPVTLHVNFKPTAGGATLDVTSTINRLDFGVGSGDYADTSTIGNPVKINAHLLLQAK